MADTGNFWLRRLIRGLIAVLLAGCVVAATASVPASAQPDPDLASIDAYIEKEMREVHIPGLALGIVHNDELVHLRGFGNAGEGRPVTPQTPFILASASKSFTALAVMQLVESGRVDLDAPVQRYLPDFRVKDEAASAQITVRHLLHHTSGLPEETAYGSMLSTDIGDEALSDRVGELGEVELRHGVGSVFEYTDANYDMLGLLVQTVSGQSFESYIAENIFEPLDMRHSYTDQSDARLDGLATGHRSWFGYPRPFEAPYSRAAHAQQLPDLQRGRRHALLDHAAQRRSVCGHLRGLPRGSRRHAQARDQARRPGHLLRHGVGVAVAERGAGGASRRHQRQLLRRHAPRPAGPVGRGHLDQLRLAQPQRRPSAGSEPWSAQSAAWRAA